MTRTLIICSTTDGQTRRICDRVQQVLETAGQQVTLTMIDDAATVKIDDFDQVIVGARIRYGKHDPRVFDFVNRHAQALNTMRSAFFSVNIVARKPEKNRPETNPYVRKFLTQVAWRPTLLDVFAGKLDYPRYKFFDRLMIRFIMLITKGPTEPDAIVEFTDWQRVEAFSKSMCELPAAAQG